MSVPFIIPIFVLVVCAQAFDVSETCAWVNTLTEALWNFNLEPLISENIIRVVPWFLDTFKPGALVSPNELLAARGTPSSNYVFVSTSCFHGDELEMQRGIQSGMWSENFPRYLIKNCRLICQLSTRSWGH